MSNNRSYRVRTEVNKDKYLSVNLTQDFDELNILSLKINTENTYRLHTSKYGCLVGRVLANGGVGIPNAKVSVFIGVDNADVNDPVLAYLYPYNNVRNTNKEGIRYNLLPTSLSDKCHQDIGTFPNKRMVLDDNNVIEIYDKYYKYTTTTNAAGDYMIFGLPVGNNIIHSELDLSDIGILSQKPRDLFYKGYNQTQFENSSQFKKDTNLDSLTQVISQDDSVYVYPFWGDDEVEAEGAESQVKITRNDINISYKFEPTCIFIGSLVSDEKSQGFSKKCVPTERMGKMDRLTTGKGTIEMIRKTPTGEIENFVIQGNDLIDGNGTWCYQIPMNLDYVKTDEFGNLVAAENETTGIPTRASVRFRVSIADYESDSANAHLSKMLVPNNPTGKPDYMFGTYTKDDSFRDLLWNNVYTVKQYIPRLQKIRSHNTLGYKRIDRNRNFSGIKAVNVNGSNNPIPYNNIRVQLTFLFMFQCIIFKCLVLITKIINRVILVIASLACTKSSTSASDKETFSGTGPCGCDISGDCTKGCGCTCDDNSCDALSGLRYIALDGAMCPQTDGWYFVFGARETKGKEKREIVTKNTLAWAQSTSDVTVKGSACKPCSNPAGQKGAVGGTTGSSSGTSDNGGISGTPGSGTATGTDVSDYGISYDEFVDESPFKGDANSAEIKYNEKNANDNVVSADESFFTKCVELQFAMEYEVIQFDFYNDWMNGCLYFPRWFAELKKRRKGDKIVACDNSYTKQNQIMMVQQCSIAYDDKDIVFNDNKDGYNYKHSCGADKNKCHQGPGRRGMHVFNVGYSFYGGKPYENNGIVRVVANMNNKFLYYLRPIDFLTKDETVDGVNVKVFDRKVCNLFATDIVLLGSVNNCNQYGIPDAKGYPSSTFIMPPPIMLLEDETQEGEILSEDDTDYKSYNEKKYFKKISSMNNGNYYQCQKCGYTNSTSFSPCPTCNSTSIKKVEISGLTELAGIDWGFNPFNSSGTTKGTEVYEFKNQRSGHFLEIGCTNSYTNVKSCINLQRICELGAEMSQSHEYGTKLVHVNGIIGNREVIGSGIRTKFATLNSNKLIFNEFDNNYGYYGLIPKSFDGSLSEIKGSGLTGLIETKSGSYTDFRFGIGKSFENKYFRIETVNKRNVGFMPIYENSFYFYFGLRDGNTAIDRLYTEYFSDCNSGEVEGGDYSEE